MTYLRFGLRGEPDTARDFLEKYPMIARTEEIRASQLQAVNVVLSNRVEGGLQISNMHNVTRALYGFGRKLFVSVLNHMDAACAIEWGGIGTESSKILYLDTEPVKGKIYHPIAAVMAKLPGDDEGVSKPVKLNNKAKRTLDREVKSIWARMMTARIQISITEEQFEIVAEWRKFTDNKKDKAKFPDLYEILPVAIFNDQACTKGGRFYRCFWIGMPREARRFVTIDGEQTSDIDGSAMHVQLLYRKADLPLPDTPLYIYKKGDPKRKITKRLMLFMMNTSKTYTLEQGRIAVVKTYEKHHGKKGDLLKYVLELEQLHKPVLQMLYQSNWGDLQCTEARIMLNIMLRGVDDDVVVLPVHDGCLCKRSERDRVMSYFEKECIIAEENLEHLESVDFEKIRVVYDIIQSEKKLKIENEKRLENLRWQAPNVHAT